MTTTRPKTTDIDWCEYNWNPWTGCQKISPGCKFCYAERMALRLRGRVGYPADDPFRLTIHEKRLKEPLGWPKVLNGPKPFVFVNSMSDFAIEGLPLDVVDYALEVMDERRDYVFLALTKRPERLNHTIYGTDGDVGIRALGGGDYLGNVMLGASVESDRYKHNRVCSLLASGPWRYFLSIEPMLGPVDLERVEAEIDQDGIPRWEWNPGRDQENRIFQHGHFNCLAKDARGGERIGWVIVGGESIHGKAKCRGTSERWVRDVRDACTRNGVPFFFKQWGNLVPEGQWLSGHNPPYLPRHVVGRRFVDAQEQFIYYQKKESAGAILDGKTHQERPVFL